MTNITISSPDTPANLILPLASERAHLPSPVVVAAPCLVVVLALPLALVDILVLQAGAHIRLACRERWEGPVRELWTPS